MSTTALPVELIAQIMCDCPDVVSVVRLSATCRKTHAVLRDNTKSIIRAVLAISPADLQVLLLLTALEFSMAEEEDYNANTIPDETDATVYSHLFYIHRSATVMAKLKERFAGNYVDRRMCYHSKIDKSAVTTSMLWRRYVKYRRSAITLDWLFDNLPAVPCLDDNVTVLELNVGRAVMELLDMFWDSNLREYSHQELMRRWENPNALTPSRDPSSPSDSGDPDMDVES